MMDPLTAFSLACGVIQVVDFSTKTVAKCVEIYKDGSSSEYRDLEDLTKHLVEARAKLDLSDANQSVGSFATPDEQSLLEVAGQCSKTADQLVEKLRSLKIEGPHKKRRAVVKSVKLLWERGEIQEIQKRLDGYRSAMDSQILISLRYVGIHGLGISMNHLRSYVLIGLRTDNVSIRHLCISKV